MHYSYHFKLLLCFYWAPQNINYVIYQILVLVWLIAVNYRCITFIFNITKISTQRRRIALKFSWNYQYAPKGINFYQSIINRWIWSHLLNGVVHSQFLLENSLELMVFLPIENWLQGFATAYKWLVWNCRYN